MRHWTRSMHWGVYSSKSAFTMQEMLIAIGLLGILAMAGTALMLQRDYMGNTKQDKQSDLHIQVTKTFQWKKADGGLIARSVSPNTILSQRMRFGQHQDPCHHSTQRLTHTLPKQYGPSRNNLPA